jgi:hypothetical protein
MTELHVSAKLLLAAPSDAEELRDYGITDLFPTPVKVSRDGNAP